MNLLSAWIASKCEDFLHEKPWIQLDVAITSFSPQIPNNTLTFIDQVITNIANTITTRVISDNFNLKFTLASSCPPSASLHFDPATVIRDKCDRPISGVLQLCRGSLSVPSTLSGRMQLERDIVTAFVRVIAFDAAHFPLFRYPSGYPRTRRGLSSRPVYSSVCTSEGWSRKAGRDARNDVKGVLEFTGNCLSGLACDFRVVTDQVRLLTRADSKQASLVLQRTPEGCFGVIGEWKNEHSESMLSPLTVALLRDSGWFEVDENRLASLTPVAFSNAL
jgi:hypothetical protein